MSSFQALRNFSLKHWYLVQYPSSHSNRRPRLLIYFCFGNLHKLFTLSQHIQFSLLSNKIFYILICNRQCSLPLLEKGLDFCIRWQSKSIFVLLLLVRGRRQVVCFLALSLPFHHADISLANAVFANALIKYLSASILNSVAINHENVCSRFDDKMSIQLHLIVISGLMVTKPGI